MVVPHHRPTGGNPYVAPITEGVERAWRRHNSRDPDVLAQQRRALAEAIVSLVDEHGADLGTLAAALNTVIAVVLIHTFHNVSVSEVTRGELLSAEAKLAQWVEQLETTVANVLGEPVTTPGSPAHSITGKGN